jgi:putative flippase GtrA
MPGHLGEPSLSTVGDTSQATAADDLAVLPGPEVVAERTGPEVGPDMHHGQPQVHGSRALRLWRWFEQGHWLGRWHSPLMVKLWRYGAGSVVAFVSSGVALFVGIQWVGLGATTSAVIAFLVGAIPNWILNRQWAWQRTERQGMGAETTLYVVVSLISLGISAGVTKAAAIGANHLQTHEVIEHLLVTGSYLLTTVALTGAKYVAYDRWVFVDRRPRSRHQVPTTTEVKRTP